MRIYLCEHGQLNFFLIRINLRSKFFFFFLFGYVMTALSNILFSNQVPTSNTSFVVQKEKMNSQLRTCIICPL